MIIKKQVIAGFNRGTTTYDQVATLQATVAQNLAIQLKNTIVPKRILEIGCGTGLFSQHLIHAFLNADICLIDISPAMIEHCRQRFADFPRVQLHCLDGEQLHSLPCFDLIVSSMTFHWFEEIEKSLTEIKQKLTPNGSLFFSVLAENSFVEWRKLCEKMHVSVATPEFPSIGQLTKLFPQLKIEIMKETYQNVNTFLRTLKLLGATASRAGHVPLSLANMRQIMQNFTEPMEITYEVVYGEYQA
ncbi:MAG: hypothetical protein ACD_45C00171G0007 [uncultured bacterium]|nr:MAG: hypothetical protein ACD_45C00171G0007 [uncultured bacterium]